MKAVILAGGEGRRLLPYTTTLPKPMMPVGNKPILELILRQLSAQGIKDIVIATGYLEELIRAFFQNGENCDVSISYSHEDRPLGTAGPLSLIRNDLRERFLLMNGDILTDLDFGRLFEQHCAGAHDLTIVLAHRHQPVDFGVVRLTESGEFDQWEEKPVLQYLVSTGIYVMEPHVLEYLPDNTFVNLPDFVTSLKGTGLKIRGLIHRGYWLDIGRPDDYEQACRDSERLRLW